MARRSAKTVAELMALVARCDRAMERTEPYSERYFQLRRIKQRARATIKMRLAEERAACTNQRMT